MRISDWSSDVCSSDLVLAIFITGLGIFTGIASLVLNRFPPFFTPPYFLALTVTESLVFGAMVAWAIRRRRATDWHRRLMIGATTVILAPSLGRLLPIARLNAWSAIPVGLVDLGGYGIVACYASSPTGPRFTAA